MNTHFCDGHECLVLKDRSFNVPLPGNSGHEGISQWTAFTHSSTRHWHWACHSGGKLSRKLV